MPEAHTHLAVADAPQATAVTGGDGTGLRRSCTPPTAA